MIPRARDIRSLASLTFAVLLIAPALSTLADPPAGTDKNHHSARAADIDPVLQEALKSAPNASEWPNSNYARLLDLGTVTVRSDGTTVAQYRETYKLFNQNARDLAEVHLPYNTSYQDLQVLSARTIRKDGSVVPVNRADIRTGGVASDYLMYDDAMTSNFSMPGIEDDCVIDYTYEIVTHPNLMPGQFMTYWGFSDAIPVAVSRYVLHVPADKPLKYKTYNDDTLQPVITTSLDGHTKTYIWERKNLKPIQLEPSMPPIADVRTWIEVSSIDSWQSIAQWFWGLQQLQARPNDAIKAEVSTLTAGKSSDEDKARAIYDWVANKTRYVGLEFGISAYKPHSAGDVFHNLYGDCKDKANLLITMLSLAGIKAHPVLLHAEEQQTVADRLPTLTAFNHCIALADIGGKDVWLDATAETCAYGDIPAGDRGVQALVVDNGSATFKTIPIYHPEENGLEIETDITSASDGAAHAETTATMRGGSAQSMRDEVRMVPPDKRKEVMHQIAVSLGLTGNVKDFSLPDGIEKSGPYVMKVSLDLPNYGKKTGTLLLMPLFTAMNGSSVNQWNTQFTSETRVWPIVSEDSSSLQCRTTLKLPPGYELVATPDDVDLVGPLQEYHRKLTRSQDGTTLIVQERFVDRPGKAPVSDYGKVRAFYTSLVKTVDDQIVLKQSK